ncbi:hypothetical protein ACQP06_22335 [Nocardia sp. CA-136227]|uniref:hypothetical protein n=1 Tax=Nocardia sp. CA-136227 TaxID=3239979 RepID=UPI003D98C3E0
MSTVVRMPAVVHIATVRAMVVGLTHGHRMPSVRVGHVMCGVLLVGGVLVVLRMRTVVCHIPGRLVAMVFAVLTR